MSQLQDNLNNILNQKNNYLLPENLKKNITLLGVTGTLEAINTSDATATANDILKDKTAYVNGQKITGNIYETDSYGQTGDSCIDNSYQDRLYITKDGSGLSSNIILGPNTGITMGIERSKAATAIGLSADNIKKGEIILGITGTYDGSEEDLPYTELVYIQSNGNQYINTDYKASRYTRIVITVRSIHESSSTAQFYQITGAKTNYHSTDAIQLAIETSGDTFCLDYGNESAGVVSNASDEAHVIEIAYGEQKADGEIISNTTGNFISSGVSNYPLWIFDCNNRGSIERRSSIELYNYKLYENNLLVMDLIPIKVKSSGVICLYDKVNHRFFYNQNSSTFIAGPLKNAGDYNYIKTFAMDSAKSTDSCSPMVDVYEKNNDSLLIIRNVSSSDTLHVWFEGDEDYDITIQPQSKSEYLYESDEPASNIDVTHMHNVSSFNWIQPT